MSFTGVPAVSLSWVAATMRSGVVSSTNCTSGSMWSG